MVSTTAVLVIIAAGLLLINTLALARLALRRQQPAAAPPLPLPKEHRSTMPELTPTEKTRLEQQAAAAFEAAVAHSTAQFTRELDETAKRVGSLVVKLTTEVVEREFDEYKKTLEAARAASTEQIGRLQQAIDEQQQSLQKETAAVLTERRQHLLDQLDRKLGEAAVAYIAESLGQNADIGAQRAWLLESLERHKAELKKDLSDGA